MKIGLISDTHGYLDPNILKHFNDCAEIWHAGDIGSWEIINELQSLATVRAVFGNIDDATIRNNIPEDLFFKVGNLKILMTHIAGSPPKYNPRVKKMIVEKQPELLICGHSHILKVMRDPSSNLLFVNSGAAGIHGFHKMRTIITFEINDDIPMNMKVIELGKRGALTNL